MTGLGGGEAIAKMLQATKRLVDALVGRGAPRVSEMHHEFPHEIRGGLERVKHKEEQIVSEFDRIGPAAHTDRNTAAEHPESGASTRGPVHGSDPTAEDGFLDLPIEEQIRRLEEAHGIRTDADRALELSLFMEDKFRDIALVSRQARPETIFDGPQGWASWLDARLYARRNLDREMSVDLMAEIHRRLQIRHSPEIAGQMGGVPKLGIGSLSRPLSRSEQAAIEENPLLTHVPGPFRTEPHGVVFQPKIEGRPGAREVRWLDAPPTDQQLAAIRDDPLTTYHPPGGLVAQHGLIHPPTENGMIVYPHFGSVDGTREFHESLCDRYNDARRQPGYDPYRLAAEFQKQLISAHAWQGDFHGRHSRILMNFGLEQAGRPPSAVAEFDHDMYASSSQWAHEVEAGSHRYGRWQDKLEQSGGDIDPVNLFDLGPMMQRYQEMGGEPSPFTPGELHDVGRYEQLHTQLRSEA
ncbi:hypothetical protein NLM24_34005 [Nocardia zapadnayensis]|uniref:hypothetical protein n=1 Tax=Nocardia rhamnosiphila TaxID=426716 RepID=UPI002245985C|nr:hypothetical protein [Nocardia zapadnayensis]MCX0275604.1 hypothetical protein [Nocardia zapadnayensis]